MMGMAGVGGRGSGSCKVLVGRGCERGMDPPDVTAASATLLSLAHHPFCYHGHPGDGTACWRA